MRVKRQKRFRKAVRFYKASFGFREPFKVLCDGNFQHYVHEQGIGELQNLLSQVLGGPAKAFTTRCINAELKKLGENYSETLLEARRLLLAKCNHEPSKSGFECLESLVENNNLDHFFVASQDVDLRKRFRNMPGCALIFSKKTSLFVEPPSEFQQQFSRADEAQRERIKEREQKIIEARNIQQSEVTTPDQDLQKRHRRSESLGLKQRPTFKRKRAKAPNPLSCKTKQKKPVPQASQDPGTEASKKRTRHRNRRKERFAEAKDGEAKAGPVLS